MRDGDILQTECKDGEAAWKKILLHRLFIESAFLSKHIAIPHPPLRGTFPPGEGFYLLTKH